MAGMIRPLIFVFLLLLAAGPASAGETSGRPGASEDIQAAVLKMQTGNVDGGRSDLEALAGAGRTDAAELLGELLQRGGFGMKADPLKA